MLSACGSAMTQNKSEHKTTTGTAGERGKTPTVGQREKVDGDEQTRDASNDE